MAMPDSVESFVELSISPSKLLEAARAAWGRPGDVQGQIDAAERVDQDRGLDRLEERHSGPSRPEDGRVPRPGRSATTNDDSLEAALKNGLTTTAAVTAMQSFFPKLTLVAEVDNPEAFGKGLDTVMIAINSELEGPGDRKRGRGRSGDREGGARRRGPHGGRPRRGSGDRTKRRRQRAELSPLSSHDQPGQAPESGTAWSNRLF